MNFNVELFLVMHPSVLWSTPGDMTRIGQIRTNNAFDEVFWNILNEIGAYMDIAEK